MAHPLPGAEIISSLPLCLTALARMFERPLPSLAFPLQILLHHQLLLQLYWSQL